MAVRKPPVFTIGYEGKSVEAFVRALKANNVKALVDVRELPLSRKPGFSKNALRARLERSDIQYLSIPQLGSPREIRHELRSSLDYPTFFKKYRDHLKRPDSRIKMSAVQDLLSQKAAAVMCFEQDAEKCHRSLLCEQLRCAPVNL